MAAASGNEGFYIDLFYNTLYDNSVSLRPSSLSTIPIEHDTAGMLAVNMPPNSCRSLRFEFLGSHSANNMRRSGETNMHALSEDSSTETIKEHADDDECVRKTHSLLREVHRAIFDEQVQLFFPPRPFLVCIYPYIYRFFHFIHSFHLS